MYQRIKLTNKQVQNRIHKILSVSNADNWQHGKQWYKQANSFCQKLANESGYTLSIVTGILAALSPNCEWEHNKHVTKELLLTGEVPSSYRGYPHNVVKAKSILQYTDPLEVLGGRKVKAFYDNILYPLHSKQVTVDTHIARIALGKHTLANNELSYVFHQNRKGNALIQSAYQAIAPEYQCRPCELQAVSWLTYKQLRENL